MSRFLRTTPPTSPALWAAAIAILGLGAGLAPVLGAEQLWTVDSATTKVTFRLGATGHDVDGTFAKPSGALQFDPEAGTVSGTITLDLRGADTGNTKRDKQMHQDVLETEKFPVATFTAKALKGKLAASGTSEITLVGELNLHGADHPVEIPAKVTIDGGQLSVDAGFAVPFVEWGLKDPSWFVLRVDKAVQVKINGAGALTAAAPAAPPAAAAAAAGR